MLAMNIDQQLTEFAQLSHGRGDAVDKRLRATPIVNNAPHEKLAFLAGQGVLIQPFTQCRVKRTSKLGRYVRARRAFAHDAGIRATTKRQRERINQNGFTCPRFAGKHGKASRKIDFYCIDNDEIMNGQGAQHVEKEFASERWGNQAGRSTKSGCTGASF